jgi:hopanoid-associated phosphorylase
VTAARIVVLTGMALEAQLAAPADVLYGLRGDALATALAERLRQPCSGVISFGMAGGLAPELPAGTLIIPVGIATHTGVLPCDAAWTAALQEALPRAVGGVLAGVDAPLVSVAEKQALQSASGAVALDMESHIGARVARHAGVPFAACRAIVDPAGREVPSAALAAFGEDGRTAMGPLLRELLRHPGQLPALLRLGGDAARARGALRAARRVLGERFGALQP